MTGEDPPEGAPVTERLFDRLTPETNALISRRLRDQEQLRVSIDDAEGAHRKREWIRFGAHLAPEEVETDTGLFPFAPPDTVHAMVREEIYCGDLFYNDMIVAALEQAGRTVGAGWAVLDFGCSSGRVIHPFSKAFEATRCFGCDPIGNAVEWAARNLPGVDFHQSPVDPPLKFADESFDFVFAISIWSHFGKNAGKRWREEMKRILKPGGIFLWSTHGPGSLEHFAANRILPGGECERLFRDLLRDGFAFYNPFGADGDWGIVSEEWGQAILHPSYVLRQTLEGWKVLAYRSRHVEGNQDLWVFEKS